MSGKFKMRCHYDVLGVERDAEDSELKKAYRRLALQWHPDKNQHRLTEADSKFKEIRGAYETLSDPNERAWYDSHREAILRSGVAGAGDDARPEDEIDLMPYFASNCFRGFEDDDGGFFGVYGKLFAALDSQEQSASLAANREKFANGPPFGSQHDDWNGVKAFYDHWTSFSTMKTFAWADEYNLGEADNRKVRRLMEEENRKLRKNEVKEFNDTVRQLVGFVKKRDKRFVKRQLEKALLEKETAALAERRKAEAKQEKHKKAAAFEEADWTKQDADGPQWLRDEVDAADRAKREKADQRLELFCPVCRKLFKSQKQWENHEQSKQHKQSVLRLKEEMMADEELVRVAMDEMESGSGSGGSGGDSDEGDEDDLREGETRDGTEKADVSVDDGSDDDEDEDASDDDDDKGDDEGDDENDDENDEDAMLARMMGHARVSKKVPVANVTDGGVSSSDDDDARSVASSAFCDRAARNKPRKMLKKNKVGRKGGVRHTEAASEFDVQRTRIEEDITEVGNDAENHENDANARSNKKTSLGFDVLDAEVRDDGVGLLEVIDDTSDTGLPKNDDDDDDDDDGEPQNLPAKKKSRRAKKGKGAGCKGAGCKTDEIGTAGELLNCALCRLVFTSGNALHKHLKEAHSGTHKKKR